MIEYSKEAKRLIATFKSYRNDIDIFTEDERKDREFYKVLFRRLIEGTDIAINDITPLGCRNNVIERCKKEPKNGRRKLFIVDGDIYVINGIEPPKLDDLYVLDSYCIENYLICENASVKFAYNLVGTKTIDEIRNELEFDRWLRNLVEPLIDLFIHFSVLQEVLGNFKIFNAYKFVKRGKLQKDLIDKEIGNLKKEILGAVDENVYEQKINSRSLVWTKTEENLLRIVSGKDYLLPLLQLEIQKIRKLNGLFTNEAVKNNLAQHCNLERLDALRERIMTTN